MEIRRQRCQKCQSLDLHNIIERKPGQRTLVFVKCARCDDLVARYELSGYYHHGRGLESWIRAGGRIPEESGRDTNKWFRDYEEKVMAQYKEVVDYLRAKGKEI
ncbi:MAG: hypothetical protein AAGD14_03630 [Planctomycetota bacterium]